MDLQANDYRLILQLMIAIAIYFAQISIGDDRRASALPRGHGIAFTGVGPEQCSGRSL